MKIKQSGITIIELAFFALCLGVGVAAIYSVDSPQSLPVAATETNSVPPSPMPLVAAASETAPQLSIPAQQICYVTVCNKLERTTLSLWKMVRDSMGKVCFPTVVPREVAVPGTVVDSQARFLMGRGLNFTKRSVTTVESVQSCTNEEATK